MSDTDFIFGFGFYLGFIIFIMTLLIGTEPDDPDGDTN